MSNVALPSITLATAVGKDPGVLVIGLAETSNDQVLIGLPDDLAKGYVKAIGRELAEVAISLGGSSKNGKTVLVAGPSGQRILVVGLGPIDVTAEQVRRAVGAAIRAVAGLDGVNAVTVSLETSEPGVIKGAAEGALLGAYSYREPSGISAITLISANRKPEAKQALDLAVSTAKAVATAREWVNLPANHLYPETFAEAIRNLAKASKLDVEVWDERALEKDGMGGILAVDRGQWEAARSLAIPRPVIWFHVIAPQAMRKMLPAVVNYFTDLLKATTLLAGIGVGEVAYVAYLNGSASFRYLEPLTGVAILFFLLIFPLSVMARRLNASGSGH